ncbi:MAG: hypothetical protein JXR52_01410 [Bacteroidales bacterium]|nr:hypothetical protein [Bacteroidales bacterium]
MRKTQRHTQAEMFAHVEACRDSNQPQKIYCKQYSIAYSTFQYWAKKYREASSEHEATEFTPGFIPVKVEPDPEMNQVTIANQLHFLFPNGIQVMCPESVHPDVLKTLLNP